MGNIEFKIDNNRKNAMSTMEDAIKLASSQLTHSILPISCPKNKEYDDLVALINNSKSQMKLDLDHDNLQ